VLVEGTKISPRENHIGSASFQTVSLQTRTHAFVSLISGHAVLSSSHERIVPAVEMVMPPRFIPPDDDLAKGDWYYALCSEWTHSKVDFYDADAIGNRLTDNVLAAKAISPMPDVYPLHSTSA